MKKGLLIILVLITTFGLGFAFKSYIVNRSTELTLQKRATGIGGIFFKCKDPKKIERLVQDTSWLKH